MLDLNPKSYASIVEKLSTMIRDLKADTVEGQLFVEDSYKALTQNIVPLHFVMDFVEKANSETYKNDQALRSATKLLSKILQRTNSLNYQMGIVKEQHLIEMNKLGVQDPFESLKSIIDDFQQPDAVLSQQIADGVFDGVQSEYLQRIKDSLSIVTANDINREQGYNAIVSKVAEALYETKTQNKAGAELISKTFNNLMESATPMMVVKQFVTDAEELDDEDAKMGELIAKIKKYALGNDLNYLINLCKEQHFAELNRSGHPNPQETIADIEKLLQLPGTEIEPLIRKGVFDNLKSELLHEVKANLGMEVQEEYDDLYENFNEHLYVSGSGLVSYTPVGLVADDAKHGKVMLVESSVLTYNQENNSFSTVTDFEPTVPQQQLMSALQNVEYNPGAQQFSLNQEWAKAAGLEMKLDVSKEKPQVIFKKTTQQEWQPMQDKHVRQFLAERAKDLKEQGALTGTLVRNVDDFIALFENANHLVLFNGLTVLKNQARPDKIVMLNENHMLQKGSETTKKLFESYQELVNETSAYLEVPTNELYTYEVQREHQMLQQKNEVRQDLIERQKALNAEIIKVKNLLNMVESDSPAEEKLLAELDAYEEELEQVIEDMKS